MKICILSKFYPPHNTEGIARTREIYAKGLAALGHEVHVITTGHDGYTYERDGVFIHEIPEIRPDEIKAHFSGFSAGEHGNYLLSYSYRLYRKIRSLLKHHSFDLIDSPLWDIEGYITKLKFPSIPMVVRLETTTRHIREINEGDAGELTVGDRFERNFLSLADGFVFDSWIIYEDLKRLYFYDFKGKPWRVIHHGIEESVKRFQLTDEDCTTTRVEECNDSEIKSKPLKVLYIGRLEKRKGSDFLIQKVIPGVLAKTKNVEFHIVGKDCSIVDGFQREHGLDYKGWCEKELSSHMGQQVRFYGYLSDEEVAEHYRSADLIANFSRYESFGLLYLEAMRMKKAQVVFENDAIKEILHGCDGPVRIPIDDCKAAIESIVDLENNRSQLSERGEVSHAHFLTYFTDTVMVKHCEQFFEVVLANQKPRVVHVMYALDTHDGVSNIALDYYRLTQKMGYETVLAGRHVHPDLVHLQLPIEDCLIRDEDIVLVHYWGYSDFLPRYHEMPGKKAILFHNVTNPYFFDRNHADWQGTAGAFAQMKELNFAKRIATFSKFSQIPIRNYFGDSMEYEVLPPLIDREERTNLPYNEELARSLSESPEKHLLFVGRVISHKKQDELVELIRALASSEDLEVKLYLVGKSDPGFECKVRQRISEYGLENRVILTGMVSEEDLIAYYRGCDLFISMSEHEGFCLPLIDAMVFRLPVIAFAQGAVAETIGNPKALFAEKHLTEIVSRIKQALFDEDFQKELLVKQEQRIEDFNEASVTDALSNLYNRLSDG